MTSDKKATAPVDWPEIHRRLKLAESVITQKGEPAPEKKAAILKARAIALAEEPRREPGEATIEVLTFRLGSESYGLELCHVREVLPLKELMPLPCTPPFVLGVINLRGRILSVIDIRKFFDFPEQALLDLSKVIVLESPQMEFGLLADVIRGIRSVRPTELTAQLPTLTDLRAKYLKGITKDGLAVLDGAKMLGDPSIVVS